MARYFSAGILIVFISLASAANAAILVSHVGSNNPTSEGWTLAQKGTATASPVLDGAVPAWKTLDTQISSGSPWSDYINYTWCPHGDLSAGWTVTAKVRVIRNVRYESNSVDFSALGVVIDIGTAIELSLDLVGNDPDQATDGLYVNPQAYDTNAAAFIPMNTTSAYHFYQFVSDPSCAPLVNLYVDGTKKGSFVAPNPPVWIGFGSGQLPDRGEANWALVQFETGVHVIPEPTSLAFLALSSFFLYRRK